MPRTTDECRAPECNLGPCRLHDGLVLADATEVPHDCPSRVSFRDVELEAPRLASQRDLNVTPRAAIVLSPVPRAGIVDNVVTLVRAGRLVLLDPRFVGPIAGGGSGSASPDQPEEPPVPPPPSQTAFIKIRVVDDATNERYGGIVLKVKLPNGQQRDFTTRPDGLVEINDIDPGTCDVTCDLTGARVTDTLDFVAMGAAGGGAATQSGGGPAAPAGGTAGGTSLPVVNQGQAAGGFTRVAEIEEHRVQTGETLDSLARGAGMTWQQLAEFNFGTSDPDEVNQHLRDKVGTTTTAPDGVNVMFTSQDDPGIILIPRPWNQTGLATNQEHVVRARALAFQSNVADCVCVPGVNFEFDKSFILPTVVDKLQELDAKLTQFPDAKIIIFGHTDRVGNDQYNKDLSDRRAKSTFGFITNNAGVWEELYNDPNERWGTREVQIILKDQGHDPGPIDGIMGDQTRAAMRSFLGLPAGAPVQNDAAFRQRLFTAYMSGKHDVLVTEAQFVGPRFMGCGEFNPLVTPNANELANRSPGNEPNRRVVFYLFKRPPGSVPCQIHSMAPCNTEINKPGTRSNPLHRCLFYNNIAKECGCEGGSTPPPPPPLTTVVPAITPATSVVVVKKPHTNPARRPIRLSASPAFSGTGTFTVSGNAINFFTAANGGAQITFNGADNVFSGAALTAGVNVFAEGASASGAMDDITLTLTLSGGPNPVGPPATATMTSVDLTLDIAVSRTADGVDPTVMSAGDKINTGRFVHVQDPGNSHGRAMIIVRQAAPAAFTGTLELTTLNNRVRIFAAEAPGGAALPLPHAIPNAGIPATGQQFFVEGAAVSGALRDAGVRLGIQGLEPDGDRVNVTVVRFSNFRVDVPSTPANTNRLANSPVPRHNRTHGGGAAPAAAEFSDNFTTNAPVVLIENSIRNADPVNLSVQVTPAGVPVSWVGGTTRATDDLQAIIDLSPSAVPTVANGATAVQATLLADAVGSFHVRAYVDTNGNNVFDAHGTDREPFILLNLVLVRVQGNINAARTRNNPAALNPAAPTAATGVGVSTGSFTIPAQAAIHNDATVTVIGGGPDGLRGLSDATGPLVFAGWINNELASPGSPTAPLTEDVVSQYRDASVVPPATRQRISLWTSVGAGTVFTTPPGAGPAAPAIVGGPVLDCTNFGNEGSGGNRAVGTEGAVGPPVAIVKTPRAAGFGQDWRVQMWDSPGDNCPAAHESFPAAVLTNYRFNLDFRSDLVFWTNLAHTPNPTPNDISSRLYASVVTNTWTIRLALTFPAAPAPAVITTPLNVTVVRDANANRVAIPVDGSGLEVRAPISLRLLATDARA